MIGPSHASNKPVRRNDTYRSYGAVRVGVVEGALLVAICTLGVIWLIRHSTAPLSPVHSYLGSRCETCHPPARKFGFVKIGVGRNVSDNACLRCHQAPGHQASLQTFVPTCASCHLEHSGPLRSQQATNETC